MKSRQAIQLLCAVTVATSCAAVNPQQLRGGSQVALVPAARQVDGSRVPFINVTFLSEVSDEARAAFQQAADGWNALILTQLPDVPLPRGLNTANGCGSDFEFNFPPQTTLTNLIIFAKVVDIDGRFGTLGAAGPCRESSRVGSHFFPRLGRMMFDSADVEGLLAAGTFAETVQHEMGHVLGIGPRWRSAGLVLDEAGPNPRYAGAGGVSGFKAIGGTEDTVPVEDVGGLGTRGAHWRTSVFSNELMTGFLSGVEQPLSLMTARSLLDLGYDIDESSPVVDRSYIIGSGPIVNVNETVPDDVWWGGAEPLDMSDSNMAPAVAVSALSFAALLLLSSH
mmetsp:Transcript_10976/g.31175  ORF Transcript_10976/g.31175 Transcript_10976/m.31175 type:complete len:337 (+) Transcript_10976:124-1134(+)